MLTSSGSGTRTRFWLPAENQNLISVVQISVKFINIDYDPFFQLTVRANLTNVHELDVYLHNRDQVLVPNFGSSFGSVKRSYKFQGYGSRTTTLRLEQTVEESIIKIYWYYYNM